MNGEGRDLASWRDPWGFVYRRHGVLLRQVNERAAEEWYAFSKSALATQLVSRGWLLPWEPAPIEDAADPNRAVAVMRPEPLDFISWPYEWTFGELRAAALLTLEVQLAAIDAGFSLRDASAYNVQFRGVTPVLIDHLSFERLPAGKPWVAYRQFCEHFLAPLALMARVDPRLARMLRDHLEGVPLDLAARLLPDEHPLPVGPRGTHPPARALDAQERRRGLVCEGGVTSVVAAAPAGREPAPDGRRPALGAQRDRMGRVRRRQPRELRVRRRTLVGEGDIGAPLPRLGRGEGLLGPGREHRGVQRRRGGGRLPRLCVRRGPGRCRAPFPGAHQGPAGRTRRRW